MLYPEARPRSSAGYTLVELILCLAVMAAFMVAMGGVVVSSFGAHVEMTASMSAEQEANRILDRIVWELRFVSRETVVLDLPLNARLIAYRKVTGWQADAQTQGAPQTISFAAGKVLLSGITIAEGVKDLTFNLNGTTLTATVDVEKTARVAGLTRTFLQSREVQISL